MVHVLPVEFRLTTSQPRFLDGDMVAEEATQVDFVTVAEDGSESKYDKLNAAFAKLFPSSSIVNL